MKIQPVNWRELQHYKDRSPIWIKLHRKLLDNYEFHCLPVASKALAPLLWLLSSEYEDGTIDASAEKIAFRLRMTVADYIEAVKPLVLQGFFVAEGDDINLLASGYQDACLEKRREERETEKEKSAPSRKIDSAPKEGIVFDFSTGRFSGVTEVMVELWGQGFPALDIQAEINKAAAWLMSNPKNRKSNNARFLTNWLSRAQDSARPTGGRPSPISGTMARIQALQREQEGQ